jgi:genome maintenance exonuclease 1
MENKFNFKKIDTDKLPKTKRKNHEGKRHYEYDGKLYPSVTTIVGLKRSAELQEWRKNVGEGAANWEMRRAANRGTALHNLIENYLNGETPGTRDVLPLGLFKILRPYLDQINNIRLLEVPMVSKKYQVAGQVDCIAEFNGKLSCIDFKSANKERNEDYIKNYFIQTTAYSSMYEEIFGEKVEQIVILMASEDGVAKSFIKKPQDYEKDLKQVVEDYYKYINDELAKKIANQ